jgi:hypothetical protein
MKNGLVLGLAAIASIGGAEAGPAGWQHYDDAKLGFSISVPPRWTIDTHYAFDALDPDKPIKGVSFTIPAAMTTGTNLSTETRLSVESLPGKNCKPAQFVDPAENVGTLHANGHVFTTASSQDAGAGNFYETALFIADGTSPCLAIRTLIHSTNIGAYDPGTVKKFNEKQLVAIFDAIRATFKITK